MNIYLIWTIAIVFFLVLEAVTYQLVSIWFAAGTIGAVISAALGAGVYAQIVVLLVIALAMIIFVRPLSLRRVRRKQAYRTNVDGLSGKTLIITHEVNNTKGTGKGTLNGMVWTVRSEDGTVISPGECVIVDRVEGVKLIVSRANAAVKSERS